MQLTALSLKQPYANWVASGKKTIETRTWSTKYRGDILICASQSGKGEPKGVALCIIEVYDVRRMITADERAACVEVYDRANAWMLCNLRRFQSPFPVKGQLGLYKIELSPELLLLEDGQLYAPISPQRSLL